MQCSNVYVLCLAKLLWLVRNSSPLCLCLCPSVCVGYKTKDQPIYFLLLKVDSSLVFNFSYQVWVIGCVHMLCNKCVHWCSCSSKAVLSVSHRCACYSRTVLYVLHCVCVHVLVCVCVGVCDLCVCVRVCEWMSEWVGGWVWVWVSEGVSEWERESVCV